MFDVTVFDLKKMSGLDQYVKILLHNQTVRKGVLQGIDNDYIYIQDSDLDSSVPILCRDISCITFGTNGSTRITNIELAKFKRQCERCAEDTNVSIGSVFKDFIQQYLDCCSSTFLKKYLEAEMKGKGAKYTVGEYEELYEYYLLEREKMELSYEVGKIIECLLLLRLRKFGKALSVIMCIEDGDTYLDISLLLACFLSHMRNYMGSLFWLERHYIGQDLLAAEDNKWWFYLRLVNKYSYYENVIELLKKKSNTSPQIAIQSLAYLLLANNNIGIASQLLENMYEKIQPDEAKQVIDMNSHYLTSDYDNNYHRYIKCLDTIIEGNKIYQYEDDESITGYIYEYVPDREFGFIIGFDLLSYFFRKESIISESLNKDIKNNICAMLSVSEEDLVLATFKRSSETKRSYNAIEIV